MTRRGTMTLLALAFAVGPSRVSAQTVLVRVVTDETSLPVFGALTYLVDPAGTTVKNGLTDERGRALFVGVAAGPYRVRAEMIGRATVETDLFDVPAGTSVSQELRLASSAIQLEGISVEADERCRVRPEGEGLAIAEVWEEARKALSAAAFTDEEGMYRYETMLYTRELDRNLRVLREDQHRREGYMLTPFESLPADSLAANGFVQPDGRDYFYYAPDAGVLLSDAFLDRHCFRLEVGGGDEEGLLGLRFEPTGDNRRIVDITGTMWVDGETAELQWLDYRYAYLDPEISTADVGGRVEFRRMPAGTWIVPEWWIRMPAVAERASLDGRRNRYVSGYRQTGGLVVEVREAGGRQLGQRVQTGGFEGVVSDSVGVPIRGARVSVVGSNQEVFTGPDGRYGITGILPGRYQVRFVDPTLERVGFISEPVTRDVIRGEATTLDQLMPSVGDVLFEACRGQERPEGWAILAGAVTDARGRPVEGVTVKAAWSTWHTSSSLIREVAEGAQATTDALGAYRLCGVPVDWPLHVTATLGDTSSETYEVALPFEVSSGVQAIVIGSGTGR